MQLHSTADERRRHKRFRIKKESSFIINPQWPDMGELVDISEGGFAFNYASEKEWSSQVETEGMLFGDHDSCLQDIPMSIVSDCEVDRGMQGNKLIVRRRSIKFGELTSNQKFLLDCFIWINSIAEC